MLAVQFDRFGPPEVLAIGEVAEPHAGQGQVRVRVKAAGVAPVDLSLRSGDSPSATRLALPHVPGVDAAGIVDEVGPGVDDVAVGDEVFGAVDIARLGGASGEFAVLAFWALRPASLPWEQAGAAGTSVETATRALDLLGVGPGQTLLIDGATGGVGSVAVQLAIAHGARVIGTGSADSAEFLAGLGAIPVAYGDGVDERVRALGTIDYALHIGGKDRLPALIELTGSPDSVVTLADFGGQQLGVRISTGSLGGQAHGRHGLAVAAALAQQGKFRVPLQGVFAFEEAHRAHALAAVGQRRGKIALAGEFRGS